MDKPAKTQPNSGQQKPDRTSPIPLSDRRWVARRPAESATPTVLITDWASI
jgi:hypothetical protein